MEKKELFAAIAEQPTQSFNPSKKEGMGWSHISDAFSPRVAQSKVMEPKQRILVFLWSEEDRDGHFRLPTWLVFGSMVPDKRQPTDWEGKSCPQSQYSSKLSQARSPKQGWETVKVERSLRKALPPWILGLILNYRPRVRLWKAEQRPAAVGWRAGQRYTGCPVLERQGRGTLGTSWYFCWDSRKPTFQC